MGLFSGLGSVVGSFFGPVGTAVGGAIGGAVDSSSAQDAADERTNRSNLFNADQAQANRDFQERMSNTSFQRRVEDLRAAGLNPMLAYSQGGAAVPGGSQANAVSPDAMINSGFRAAEVSSQQAVARAQADNLSADTENKRAQTENFAALADNTRAQTRLMESQVPVQETTARMQMTMSEKHRQDIQESLARVEQLGRQGKLTDEEVRKVQAEIPNIILGRNLIAAHTTESNARALATESQARLTGINTGLAQLQFPRAVNESKAQESWWMKHVSPYLPDILKGTSIYSTLPK